MTDFRIGWSPIKMWMPQCKIGSIPGLGGISRLISLIGITNAKKIIFSGNIIP